MMPIYDRYTSNNKRTNHHSSHYKSITLPDVCVPVILMAPRVPGWLPKLATGYSTLSHDHEPIPSIENPLYVFLDQRRFFERRHCFKTLQGCLRVKGILVDHGHVLLVKVSASWVNLLCTDAGLTATEIMLSKLSKGDDGNEDDV